MHVHLCPIRRATFLQLSPPALASALQWELIAGPDLLDLLNEHHGRLPESMAAFIFVQLVEAVTFMHTAGFCHRYVTALQCSWFCPCHWNMTA